MASDFQVTFPCILGFVSLQYRTATKTMAGWIQSRLRQITTLVPVGWWTRSVRAQQPPCGVVNLHYHSVELEKLAESRFYLDT